MGLLGVSWSKILHCKPYCTNEVPRVQLPQVQASRISYRWHEGAITEEGISWSRQHVRLDQCLLVDLVVTWTGTTRTSSLESKALFINIKVIFTSKLVLLWASVWVELARAKAAPWPQLGENPFIHGVCTWQASRPLYQLSAILYQNNPATPKYLHYLHLAN